MNQPQDNSIQQVKALAWEFWAHGWRGQLLGLAGIVGFASLLYSAILVESDISFRGTQAGSVMHFGFYWAALFFLGAPILAAWGVPRRRYTLPTSSLVVVACSMVCSMATMFVLYAIAAMTLNVLFDASWPIIGPGLVAALVVAWLQAILWSTSNSRGLQMVSSLASFVVLLFAVARFAAPGRPTTGWFYEGLDRPHVVMFALATLVCVGVGTVGFESLRRGGGIDVNRIVEWAGRLFPKAARTSSFSSATSAQVWLEWSERGYVMPVGTALIGVAVLLIASFVSAVDAADFLEGISGILLLPAIAVGLYLGSRSDNGQFGNFNGSRPLTDSQVANAILTSATIGIFSLALIWAAFIGTASLIIGQRRSLGRLLQMSEPSGLLSLLGMATLGVGALWAAVTLVTSLVLAGKKVGTVVACTVVGVLIAGSILPRLFLSREDAAVFREVYLFACVAIVTGCIVAIYVVSWRHQLISRTTLVLAASIALVMFAAAHLTDVTSNAGYFFPALWACCLTPSALAAAPLAVWWNRHR